MGIRQPDSIVGSVVALAAGVLLWAAPGPAAADAAKQVQTATQHALFAAKAQDTDGVRLHLHHVINCLVGPGKEGFDAAAGNPCKGQGDGALVDIGTGTAAVGTLEQALDLAMSGLRIDSTSAAQKVASAVADLRREAEEQMM